MSGRLPINIEEDIYENVGSGGAAHQCFAFVKQVRQCDEHRERLGIVPDTGGK